MTDYLNKATIKLDQYVKRMPNLMDLKIRFSSNLKDLVKELNKVVKLVTMNYEKEIESIKFDLEYCIKKAILTRRKIDRFNSDYNNLNKEIKTFNEMIAFLHKFFNTEVKGKDTNTILYNPDELKYKKLINETLSYKITIVEVDFPQEPIYTPDDIDEGLSIRLEDREEA